MGHVQFHTRPCRSGPGWRWADGALSGDHRGHHRSPVQGSVHGHHGRHVHRELSARSHRRWLAHVGARMALGVLDQCAARHPGDHGCRSVPAGPTSQGHSAASRRSGNRHDGRDGLIARARQFVGREPLRLGVARDRRAHAACDRVRCALRARREEGRSAAHPAPPLRQPQLQHCDRRRSSYLHRDVWNDGVHAHIPAGGRDAQSHGRRLPHDAVLTRHLRDCHGVGFHRGSHGTLQVDADGELPSRRRSTPAPLITDACNPAPADCGVHDGAWPRHRSWRPDSASRLAE